MTEKSIWEKRWKGKSRDTVKSTSLDFFAINAFKILDKYIEDKDKKILEVGSGTGRFCIALAQKYPDKNIVGIDYTAESVELSNKGAEVRNLKNVKFLKADLFKLPYDDHAFDFVFENGVIEHFRNYKDAIKEMMRVAKNGGTIVVNVNNWYCFPKTIEKKILGKYYPFGYEKSFKHKELSKTFRELGLKEIDVIGYNPSNALVRYFFFNSFIKKNVASFAKFFENMLDFLSNGRFSKRFGYMIFAVERK